MSSIDKFFALSEDGVPIPKRKGVCYKPIVWLVSRCVGHYEVKASHKVSVGVGTGTITLIDLANDEVVNERKLYSADRREVETEFNRLCSIVREAGTI